MASFEVIDFLDTRSKISGSTPSAIAALDASPVSLEWREAEENVG